MCSLVRIVNRSASFSQARRGGNYKGKKWWGGAKGGVQKRSGGSGRIRNQRLSFSSMPEPVV